MPSIYISVNHTTIPPESWTCSNPSYTNCGTEPLLRELITSWNITSLDFTCPSSSLALPLKLLYKKNAAVQGTDLRTSKPLALLQSCHWQATGLRITQPLCGSISLLWNKRHKLVVLKVSSNFKILWTCLSSVLHSSSPLYPRLWQGYLLPVLPPCGFTTGWVYHLTKGHGFHRTQLHGALVTQLPLQIPKTASTSLFCYYSAGGSKLLLAPGHCTSSCGFSALPTTWSSFSKPSSN